MEPAFVIISYDSVPAVRDCIRTARRSFPQSEIVVVDQSFDRCVRTICDEFSDIKLLEATAGRTIEWLVDVHIRFNLLPETLFICVNLMDRYC